MAVIFSVLALLLSLRVKVVFLSLLCRLLEHLLPALALLLLYETLLLLLLLLHSQRLRLGLRCHELLRRFRSLNRQLRFRLLCCRRRPARIRRR